MLSPTCQDAGPFREWAPLTGLLQKIPAKIQTGIFTHDINFTCIDVVAEFIAVGTNHGLIYWFNRKTEELETLTCENTNSSITCVKIVSTVDYMVAAGSDHGEVTIFQIPKQVPDSLPETLKPKRKKQVERFNISGLHQAPVTAVEWSKNGMKLFSGDQNGLIVLTEMDFYLHLSKSVELLNEKYSVVQLSYQSGLLLISTLFRTIIVDRNENNKIIQLGQKERKVLGKFGAVFSRNKCHTREQVIYASRPGLRIWQASKNGIVSKTLILKDAVKLNQSRVELLNPALNTFKRKYQRDPIFGIILSFVDDLIVTYNEDIIYIINPNTIMITSMIRDLRRVTDISCSDDEIFILEGERNIVRIAAYPDTINIEIAQDESLSTTPIAELSKPVSWGLTELTSKLKSSQIMPNIPFPKVTQKNLIQSTSIESPVVIGIDASLVIDAEEAAEIPPITCLKLDTQLVTGIDALRNVTEKCPENHNKFVDRKDVFKKISEQEFEEVVFSPQKRKKDKKPIQNSASTFSTEPTNLITNGNDIQTTENEMNNVLIASTKQTQLFQDIENVYIVKSEKNLETIEKAILDKEKLLSGYLNLDLSVYMDKCELDAKTNNCNITDSEEINTNEIFPLVTSKIQNVQLTDVITQKSENKNSTVETYKFNNAAGSSVKDCDNNTDNVPWNDSCNLNQNDTCNLKDDNKMSERQFNALSKEFVKSTIQDNDDWILLG